MPRLHPPMTVIGHRHILISRTPDPTGVLPGIRHLIAPVKTLNRRRMHRRTVPLKNLRLKRTPKNVLKDLLLPPAFESLSNQNILDKAGLIMFFCGLLFNLGMSFLLDVFWRSFYKLPSSIRQREARLLQAHRVSAVPRPKGGRFQNRSTESHNPEGRK